MILKKEYFLTNQLFIIIIIMHTTRYNSSLSLEKMHIFMGYHRSFAFHCVKSTALKVSKVSKNRVHLRMKKDLQ